MLVAEKKTEDAINIRRMWLRYTNHTQAIWFYLIPVDEMQHVRLVESLLSSNWSSRSCSHFPCFASGQLFQTGYAIAGTGPGRDLLAGVTRACMGHWWGSLMGSRQVCCHKLKCSKPEKEKNKGWDGLICRHPDHDPRLVPKTLQCSLMLDVEHQRGPSLEVVSDSSIRNSFTIDALTESLGAVALWTFLLLQHTLWNSWKWLNIWTCPFA